MNPFNAPIRPSLARLIAVCGCAAACLATARFVQASAVAVQTAPPGVAADRDDRVRAAVERVLPSVVVIESFGGADSLTLGRRPPRGRSAPPDMRAAIAGLSKPGEGPTTGLIISPDGYVLTSTFNFIRKPDVITVTLHDGSRHLAELVASDHTRRLALLRVANASDWPTPATPATPPAGFVDRRSLKVGQTVATLGYGFDGDTPAVSVGILSALQRIYDRAVQTDASVSPANYGGPLIDLDGRVIGVCVPLTPQLGPAAEDAMAGVEWYDSGIGFAIPLSDLGPVIDQLKQGRSIRPPWLGIAVRPADQPPPPTIVRQVHRPGTPGAAPNIPAPSPDNPPVVPTAPAQKPADPSPDKPAPNSDPDAPKPAKFVPRPGLIVVRIAPGSPADAAGLKVHDRITAIDDRPILEPADFLSALGRRIAGDTLRVAVERDAGPAVVAVKLTHAPTDKPRDELGAPQPQLPSMPGSDKGQ